jgi:hypothetical protein
MSLRRSTSPQIPNKRPKRRRFDPHRFLGKVVLYGLAFDGGVRFLHWLTLSLMHEFGR